MRNSRHNPSRNSPANRQRPQPTRNKSVYLRRRIIALVVLAVIVALIWSLVAAAVGWVQNLFAGNSSVNPAESGTVSGASCDPGSILLEPIVANSSGAEQAALDTGINPFFGYRITNVGAKDCTFDVGAKDTFLKVTSGSETIWNSADCDRTALVSSVMTLKPNEPMESPLSDWYRVKSSSSGCGAEQTPVTAGGASYHLNVEVGGVSSKETFQFILN
jgi:hypothetical protein